MNGPIDEWILPSTEQKAQYCLKAAELHLQRAIALADTEWKVSLAFWGVLLASGVSFITYTNTSSPPMTVYIAHSDVLFLLPYLLSAAIFVFGFSVNQAKSIVEERSRYRFFLNEAAAATGHPYRLADADPDGKPVIVGKNRVWAQKLLSTFLFVTGIWATAQWLAHGKLAIDAAKAIAPHGKPDLLRLPFDAGNVACAFFECHDRGHIEWGDWPELGTILWGIAAITTMVLFIKAHLAGRR